MARQSIKKEDKMTTKKILVFCLTFTLGLTFHLVMLAQDKLLDKTDVVNISEIDSLKIQIQLLRQENADLKLKLEQANGGNMAQALYKQYGIAQEGYDLRMDCGNNQPCFVKRPATPKP